MTNNNQFEIEQNLEYNIRLLKMRGYYIYDLGDEKERTQQQIINAVKNLIARYNNNYQYQTFENIYAAENEQTQLNVQKNNGEIISIHFIKKEEA
jgi:hypothetical protein